MNKKIKILQSKIKKNKLVCLTSYSYSISKILDNYCDIILVGDSLANVLYGMKNIRKITLDTIINHAKSVRAGVKKALMVVDMPANTYRNPKTALKNAKKIIKATNCDAIKIESNWKNNNIIKVLIKSKINVMSHIGYTPQFNKRFRVFGKTHSEQTKLLRLAKEIEKSGAFSIVLECINSSAAKKITETTKIPTIGIGSSKYCNGQILVTDDIIGMSGFYPKFIKKYANTSKIVKKAVYEFSKEVKNNKFPKRKNSF